MLLLRPLARYAVFKGRASRSEYWLFMVSQSLVYIGCVVLAVASLGNRDIGAGLMGLVGWLALALLLMVVFALPNYAVMARRLHDTGRSAIWMALLLPVVATNFVVFNTMGTLARRMPVAGMDGGAGFGEAVAAQLSGIGVLGVVGTISSTVLFVLTLLPGTRGPNRFGPDPKDPDATAPMDDAGLDEDRWDTLIAEAKGAARAAEPPYKPVFDFGPGPVATTGHSGSGSATTAPAGGVEWARPAWDPGVTPSRPFGRRS